MLSTIIIGAITAAFVIAVAVSMLKDRKKTSSRCGACTSCPLAGDCHKGGETAKKRTRRKQSSDSGK